MLFYWTRPLLIKKFFLVAEDCTIPSSGIANCGVVVTGNLLLPADIPVEIDLGNVTTIDGSLVIENTGLLQKITGSQLALVGGNLTLGNVTALSNLSFPALSQVGAINLTGVSSLEFFNFGDPGIQKVSSVLVTNTELNSLAGLDFVNADTVNINNNPFLSDISLHTNIVNVEINIGANDVTGDGQTLSMPNLTSVSSMILYNVSQLSVPSLQSMDNFTIYGGGMEDLKCPQLSQIGKSGGGGFIIDDCSVLKSVQMPNLTQIGGLLSLTNNTNLTKLDGFPNLEDVGGNAVFSGNISR